MNLFIAIGRLCHDPVLKTISKPNGEKTYACNFKLAITDKYKKATTNELGKRTAFLNLEIYDSGATVLCNNFKKGDPILVNCTVKTYRDKDDPSKNSIVFRVTHFEFLPYSRSNDDDDDDYYGDDEV